MMDNATDKLTPEEMKAFGPDRLTPAEVKGTDLGPRSPRMSRDPKRRGQPEDTVDENARLGLTSGMADPRLPDEDMDLSGDGLATAGPELSQLEKRNRDVRREEHPFEGDVAFLKEAAPWAAGGALGKGASMLLGRAATGASPAVSRGADAAAKWLEHSLHYGTLQSLPIHVLRAMFPRAGAVTGNAARTAATGMAGATTGAGAMGAGEFIGGDGQPEESPKQRAARLLLGQSPNFVER